MKIGFLKMTPKMAGFGVIISWDHYKGVSIILGQWELNIYKGV